MALSVAVLGCDGSYPGPGGSCSGYLVRTERSSVWLDAGPGTLASLQMRMSLGDVDAIVLSHEHPDHWSDLEGFIVACRYQLGRTGVRVFAPDGLRERVYHQLGDTLEWVVVSDGDRIEVDDLRIRFSRTDHGPETLAVRVDGDGRSLGYSADSGPGWSFEALGPGINLALCEATFTKDHEGETDHMSARQAGAMVREAGITRVVLTHRWPTIDADRIRHEGSEELGRPVMLAESGLAIRV